jgi:L,D-peptidoglycan transpeptidase YkuD (ErfK/YbiS/YcfS/YnhG family)
MVVKNIRNFVVLFSIVMAAVLGNAQTALHGKFQLTSQARWGKAVLPAGQYSFTIESTQQPVRMVIQSADGKTGAIAQAETSGQASPGGSYIFITGTGTDRMVRSVNLPQLGTALVYKPLTTHERETLYSSASQTVPVEIAKK